MSTKEELSATLDAMVKTLHAIRCVTDERGRQLSKWGVQDWSPLEWMAILVEEVGEAQKEALEHHFSKAFPVHYPVDAERLARYRAELIQVAAVAVAAVESIDRNELKASLAGTP